MGLKERVVLPLARRWIAGADLDSAIKDARKANSRGIGVIINFLGEEIKDPRAADAHAQEYLRLQHSLSENAIDGFASVKLTQLGLGVDDAGMYARLEEIAADAEGLDQLLWIDMESSRVIDRTIATYLEAHQRHFGLGIALQAYTKRGESDLKSILDAGGRVRLVKGAYKEPHDLVYHTRAEVRMNYEKMMATLFERGTGFAIATHDGHLIDRAKKLADSSHTEFHFELLKGIRDELKDDLVRSGYRVFEYLPYGDSWYAYSKRRISEHPSNIWLLLRSLV